jgi:hypothetical protein
MRARKEETVVLSVDSPRGFLVRKVFQGWSGDVESSSGVLSLTMDGPKTLTAVWKRARNSKNQWMKT